MEQSINTQNHAPCLIALGPLILGLVLAEKFHAAPQMLLGFAGLSAALAFYCLKYGLLRWIIAFTVAATFAAWAYGEIRFPQHADDSDLSLPPRLVSVSAKIERVFARSTKYSSGIGHILEASNFSRLNQGARVYLQISGSHQEEQLKRGQTVRVEGVLRPINPDLKIDPFSLYLRDSGVDYRIVQVSAYEALSPASAFKVWCERQKRWIEIILRNGSPETSNPESIYTAMLLGEKSDLSEEQLVRFSQSGTMHLFAISGLHIGVISTVLAQALTLIRIPRRIAPFIGLSLLYVYVEITGAAPSAVRALIMVAFFWISLVLNRQRSPFGALVASAFLVLVIDPWQLWQTGFQLSYLVVASILLFGLPFYRLTWPIIRPFDDLPQSTLGPIRRTAIFGLDRLWMLFGVSFSAWLVSAPLSMSISGYVAPYAVITNLLLVNLAALTITTGVISISLTLASFTGLSLFFNHAAWITIHLMEWVVLISSKIPGASLAVSDFPKIYAHVTIIIFLVSIFAISENRRLNQRFLLLAPLIIFIGVSLGNLIS